jgi:hypothetical protein
MIFQSSAVPSKKKDLYFLFEASPELFVTIICCNFYTTQKFIILIFNLFVIKVERISFLDAQLKFSFVVKKTSLAFPERISRKRKENHFN